MISGTLFLGRGKTFKTIKKNVTRIITVFIFWSIVYATTNIFIYNAHWSDAIRELVVGHYHMWFCYMIVGLYLIVPFVEKIVVDMKLTERFLLIAIIFSFLIPYLINIGLLFNNYISNIISSISWNFNLYFTYGYESYFVLGFYISKETISKKVQSIIYVLGGVGYLATCFLTLWLSRRENEVV